MYAKSFLARDGQQRLTSALTAQRYPYDRYTCHLCGSELIFHPEYLGERPWFEHQQEALVDKGHQCCPYVKPERAEIHCINQLHRYVPDTLPWIRKTDWHCSGCNSDYHGERYCLSCRTGEHSSEISIKQ
ncbi:MULTISPECIES: putative zinc ribbon protein [Enterobacteriaceae]|uniref:Protein of uncharacterized function (DUF3279) n=1 Tax=Enterobacter roggenkampii TaxID=1812935 RepID=A0ABD7KP67_9ENTR|nr:MULTISPECIES: putative zinc ribbon protein [Enterobacteriaceae]CNK41113.1 Protein of uncharacterised function (DUF3279) [Yersinia frederiksenii]CNL12323.1 Protein of uncharacterised function (DUF3279) [Yersinia frederiksenii]SAD41583.1 Protein of uncharacterised function (DUF3279) [Enterobacter roggenkampii]HEE0118634.1 hypothetical protein [Citrobacter gillenii]